MLDTIDTELNILIKNFLPHPFLKIPKQADLRIVCENFYALSLASPYLQAGALKEIFFNSIINNPTPTKEIECTSLVAAYLCLDEFGSSYLNQVLKKKTDCTGIMQRISSHAKLFRKDCLHIFKEEIQASYSSVTLSYLNTLFTNLSSFEPMVRVANMVAFENHAEQIIKAFGKYLKTYSSNKKLVYFELHVGAENPAEEIHVQLTRDLINLVVDNKNKESFYEAFRQAYQLNHQWACDIINLSLKTNDAISDSFAAIA